MLLEKMQKLLVPVLLLVLAVRVEMRVVRWAAGSGAATAVRPWSWVL